MVSHLKKESDLSRLMSCAGRHKAFTYASWVLSAVSALMALFAFYEAAFDVGLGRRRMQLATGLIAAYLGCAALSGSGYLILYFGCAVWALTDLCSLTPKPKQENAA